MESSAAVHPGSRPSVIPGAAVNPGPSDRAVPTNAATGYTATGYTATEHAVAAQESEAYGRNSPVGSVSSVNASPLPPEPSPADDLNAFRLVVLFDGDEGKEGGSRGQGGGEGSVHCAQGEDGADGGQDGEGGEDPVVKATVLLEEALVLRWEGFKQFRVWRQIISQQKPAATELTVRR